MALSLGVKKGSKIRIGGDKMLVVDEILRPDLINITVDGKSFTIDDLESQTILPDVKVFAGLGSHPSKNNSNYARLAFDAPYAIRIERVPETVS